MSRQVTRPRMSELHLDPQQALAGGRDRLVFQHPARPDRIIKVMRPRYVRMQGRRWIVPFSMSWRFGTLKHFAREVAYGLELRARHPELVPLMAEILGFETTSLGLGLVCEKIGDGHGGLAPTLAEVLARPGVAPAFRARAAGFLEDLAAAPFVFRDVSSRNIVVAPDRFVVVDGFGDFNVLPLRHFSRALNRFCQRHDIRALRTALDL